MAFDGVPYVSPALISPIAHHPAAPITGQALAGALTTAYSSARNDARLIMQQTYGYNGQDPALAVSLAGYVVAQTSYFRIAQCVAHIPAEVTHVRAQVIFAAVPFQDATAYHRIVVTDAASATATGAAKTTSVARGLSGAFVLPRAIFRELMASDPYVVACDVDVSGLTLAADCTVYVEGYAAGTLAATYKPHIVSAWWEIVG